MIVQLQRTHARAHDTLKELLPTELGPSLLWSNDPFAPAIVFSLRLLILTVEHASNDVLWCELRNAKYGLDALRFRSREAPFRVHFLVRTFADQTRGALALLASRAEARPLHLYVLRGGCIDLTRSAAEAPSSESP
jgi:hypothetical protein